MLLTKYHITFWSVRMTKTRVPPVVKLRVLISGTDLYATVLAGEDPEAAVSLGTELLDELEKVVSMKKSCVVLARRCTVYICMRFVADSHASVSVAEEHINLERMFS